MSRRLALSALSLLLLLLPHSSSISSAQSFVPGSVGENPKEAKPDPATEKKAVDLLENISDQVMNLHSPSNRIHGECTIADLLWSRDEKRARALFKAATEQLIALIADIDYGDQQVYQEISNINQQRQEIITRLASHDPDLALSFLRETRLQKTGTRVNWNFASEQNLELQLARLVAAKNPARALELARGSLPQGVSWSLISFLSQLQQKDPKAAQTLYQEMVGRIKSEDLERNQEFVAAAWNLLSAFPPPQANEETYRDLLTTLVDRALAITPGQSSGNVAQNLYGQINGVMPQIEKYAPARAAELRQWSKAVERILDPSARMYQELGEFSQHGTVDEILALTSKYPAEFHSQIYQNAAWKAFSDGDPTRARQIVNDLVADPIQRRQILDQFDNQSFYNAPTENKAAEAHTALSRMRTLDRKVQLLVQVAMMLHNKGDKKGALEFLDEANALVAAAPPGSMQLWAQLQLAQQYASVDSERGFPLMQSVIIKMNELVAAAAVVDGFDSHYLRDGEWTMPGASGLGGLVNSMDQTLANLVRLDFDRARSLADQIQRPEIRLTVDLHLAQAVLGSKFERQPVYSHRVMGFGGAID